MISFETGNVWKYATVATISAILAGLPSYLVLASKSIDYELAQKIVSENSPYNDDRRLIERTLNEHEVAINNIASQLEDINNGVQLNSGKLDVIQTFLITAEPRLAGIPQ